LRSTHEPKMAMAIMMCLRKAAFWALLFAMTSVLLPLWLIMLAIFVNEKSSSELFILGYDTLLQRWLLHIFGARGDPHSCLILENGVPGIEYINNLPKLTGYVPDFMRTEPDPKGPSALYITRIVYIDGIVETGTKNGDIEQLLVIGAGWDFRGLNTAMAYPNITVIEVDTPKMVEVKLDICREKGIKYGENVTTIPLVLKSKSDLTELRSRIDMKKKTLIILEGVSVFLTGEVNEAIIELLRDLPGGSELVADYWIKEKWSWSIWCRARWGKFILRKIMDLIGRPILFDLSRFGGSATLTIDSFARYAAADLVEVIEAEDTYIGVLARIRSCM